MAVTLNGQMTGSVSGGCVEGAVAEAGINALATGRARLLHFGVADETAWGVGLACGGSIDVFVAPFERQRFNQIREAVAAEQAIACATIIAGDVALVGKR